MKPKDKELAKERIKELFEEADKVFEKNPKLANRYVEIARKISMKTKVRIPRELKRKFCKHCYSYLRPGKNCRVRNYKSRVVYYCENCRKHMRFQINKKKS